MDLTGLPLPGVLLYALGALMLLVALTWGNHQYRTQNRRNHAATERAARHPNLYSRRREAPKRKVE